MSYQETLAGLESCVYYVAPRESLEVEMFQIASLMKNRTDFKPKPATPVLLSGVVLLLSACNGVDNDPASPLRTGVFLDSAVEGLGFETATMSGITNAAGEFTFNAGEMITFRIGALELPAVQAANVLTPMSIFASNDVNDTRTVNLSRLLQSLDTDGNVENGITLPASDASFAADLNIDFASDDFDVQAQTALNQLNNGSIPLVDGIAASAHLTETLIENNLISSDCTADHRYVGRTSELSNLAHGVSGTVTVIDDCTIEVTNFNYDGGGPSVYFYAATDRDFRNYSAIIGPRLNGQRWVNDTLRLSLPDGTSLEDFNSLSVWCRDFNANFGDTFFGDL